MPSRCCGPWRQGRLLIVGDGEERDNLEDRAARLGLRESVSFSGAVPQTEVQRYLWAADVFICVNELSNVGNPLLEAMLAGRCILTLDEGDTRDVIKDGETGVLLSSGEPSLIAEALQSLARIRLVGSDLRQARARLPSRTSGAGGSGWMPR